MKILGISCFYHDAAACLLQDGEIVAAAQEERFTRKKHDLDFPINAIRYCLKEKGLSINDLDYIGFYDKPLLKFERILYTYLATFPRSLVSFSNSMPLWLSGKLYIPDIIKKQLGWKKDIIFIEHHLSHAASAFLVSPFERAAILTVDGVGEWATATYGIGEGNKISLFKEIRFPDSLGLLYSAFTYYLGFKVNDAEYKVMGLAPYGRPIYYDLIMDKLINVKEDGSFRMNLKYFAYTYGMRMTNKKFNRLFGYPVRKPESQLERHHKDIAASIQKATEEIMLRIAKSLHKETGEENLCLAGGVAFNCVANGRILIEAPFKDIYIQPAAGDAGGAVGVAHYIYNSLLGNKRNYVMNSALLGPQFSRDEIKSALDKECAKYKELPREELLQLVARLIVEQNVIGWFQGRMEWGPRALGARSILADARNPENKDKVNLKIKFRESFRPFAPTVLNEHCNEYFELDRESPFMLLVAQVREGRRTIPSVTHLDGSARIQTIRREENPLYYDLLNEFYKLTGCPVIINTSFNIRGEPIVCTPQDAYRCFTKTGMDYLVMDSFLLSKQN